MPLAAPPLPAQRPEQGDGPPATVPPPVPPPIEGAPQPVFDDLLARYQRNSKRTGPGIKERLRRALDALTKRAGALKHKHDIKNLQTAIQGQHESLGALSLQHHPREVDIGSETAELSQIQESLAEKQATREALRQTKGSGAAVKALDREMGQLRARQRDLMIAIGQKAEANKAQMPGAAGHYSGLDQLRSLLGTKQSELKTLEEQIGPIREGQGLALAGLKKPLVIGGAVLAGIVLLWLLWTIAHALFAGTDIDFRYVPDNAAGVAYVNVEKLRKTDLYERLEDMIVKETRGMPVDLQPKDVKSLFAVMLSENKGLGVLRTYEDLPLGDVISGKNVKIDEYKEVEYAQIPGAGYLAKTGKRTYCFADDEKGIKQTVDRLRRKEKGKLSEALQTALDYVDGQDHYLVMEAASFTGGLPGDPSQQFTRGLKSVGIGASVGSSSLNLSGVFVFRRDRDAQDFAEEYERAIEDLESTFTGPSVPKNVREAFAELFDMLRGLKVKQSGEKVTFRGSWKLSQVEDLIELFGRMNRL